MKLFVSKPLIGLLLLTLLAGSKLPVWGQQIQGAELTYTLDAANPLKIRIQLTTYTDFSHTIPDNFQATIYVGPNRIQAERHRRHLLPNGYYQNIYLLDYVFAVAGSYLISFSQANRAPNLVNLPDSDKQPYWISSRVVLDPNGLSNHHSIRLLSNPVQVVPVGKTTRHHLGAYDPEGDSLAFELIPSLQGASTSVQGYRLPGFVAINSHTGELLYTRPTAPGHYALAVKITEYRHQKAIGFLIRDFTIMVLEQTAAFAQSLTVSPGAGTSISAQNDIYVSPGQELLLEAVLADAQADTTRLEVYSDLLTTTEKFRVSKNSSGTRKSISLQLEAEPTLKRQAPYLIVLRAESQKGSNPYNRDKTFTEERGFRVFIGPDRIEGAASPEAGPGLRLYPNPAVDVICIELSRFRPGLQLQVYNTRGQVVWQQSLKTSRTYLLRRQLGSGSYQFRIYPATGYLHQAAAYSGHFIFR